METPAEGDAVRVEVAVVEGEERGGFVDLASWAIHQETKGRLPDAEGWGLVFAGSMLDEEGYGADKAGTVVGLTGFGTEVIGAVWGLSPQAAIDEPVWIVDKERAPEFGTEVVVRITRLREAASVEDGADAGEPGSE